MTFDLVQAQADAVAEKYIKILEDQAAEIERLRAELASANVGLLAAGELLTRLKRVREAEIDQAGAAERIYLEGVRAKDVRIKELEDALVEERARALWFEGDDPCDPPNLDWKTEPNDIPESVRLLWGESARQQLQAEGKIGPDARPRSWQITEERIRAIQWAEEMAGDCKAGDVLRAMLTEAGQ